MSLPKRKHPRLKQHDYSEPGAYFITVCTKNKAHILSRIAVDLPSSVGRDAREPRDYDEIFQYIQNNPAKWPHDQFYTSDGEEHP